jgi:hypothetical protein
MNGLPMDDAPRRWRTPRRTPANRNRQCRIQRRQRHRRHLQPTAPTSPKVLALSSRPEVALTIDNGDTPEAAKALLVRGLATLETVDGVTDEYIAASNDSMGESEQAEFERNVRSVYKQTVASRSSRSGRGSTTSTLGGYPLSSPNSSTMVSGTRVACRQLRPIT